MWIKFLLLSLFLLHCGLRVAASGIELHLTEPPSNQTFQYRLQTVAERVRNIRLANSENLYFPL